MRSTPQSEPEINKFLRCAIVYRTDLHLRVGKAPMLRLKGVDRETALPQVSNDDLKQLLLPILSAEQKQHLEEDGEVAFTYVFDKPQNEFRMCVLNEDGQLALSAYLQLPE